MKLRVPIEELCSSEPIEFSSYLNYCRSLRFEDRPDYTHLKRMFKDLMAKEGYEQDWMFDWVIRRDLLVDPSVLPNVEQTDDMESRKSKSSTRNEDDDKKGKSSEGSSKRGDDSDEEKDAEEEMKLNNEDLEEGKKDGPGKGEDIKNDDEEEENEQKISLIE